MHILRHHGVGQLGRHRAAHLPAHGNTRVEAHESLGIGTEQAGVETRIKAPLRGQSPRIFSKEVQLVRHIAVAARGAYGVVLFGGAHDAALRLRLRSEHMPCVGCAEAYVVTRRGTVVELCVGSRVIDHRAVAVGEEAHLLLALLAVAVVVGIVVARIVLGERGVEVGKELWREHIVPVEGHVAVAPSHVHARDVVVAPAVAVRVGGVFKIAVILGVEAVASGIEAQRQTAAVREDMCELRVHVVKKIAQRHLVVASFVEESADGGGEQVEPTAAQAEDVGCAAVTADWAFEPETSVERAYGVAAVGVGEVAVLGAHIGHRRQAARIACGEATLVEVDTLHDVGVERREQAQRVVDLIEGRAVEQEQVLVVAAAMDIEARHQFHTRSHTRRELQRLHQVRR